MLKHKSFVLKSKKKPKAKVMSMHTRHCNAPRPKIATNNPEIQDSVHYDKNEKITLSLPQSLSYEEEDYNEHSHTHNHKTSTHHHNNHAQANDYDYEEVDEENSESYSDANTYFEKENNYVNQQSNQVNAEESLPNLQKKEDLNKEVEKVHDAVVVNPDEILNDESIAEQDKKFEADIAAILTGKKQFDKARVAKDPAEALKDKNRGMIRKKDDTAIEDKLKNDHAIFDKIAQSMEMASSYDLGSIAMDKKFDVLEKETDKDFTKKIHELIEDDKPKKNDVIEDAEIVNTEVEKKDEIKEESEEDKEKVETKDFLNDLDKLNTTEANHKKEVLDTLSKQSSFTSTISIKHRYLKSRVFAVSGSTVEVKIDSNWVPLDCSEIKELNVTLTRSIDYWPDDEISTKNFRIGGPDTKTWNDLKSGNYYLTFFFVNNTNPNCELSGSIEVKS